MLKRFSIIFLLSVLVVGCSEKVPFTTQTLTYDKTVDQVGDLSYQKCGRQTIVKPNVDVLFVVDNSTSTYFIPNDIKNAIGNTVALISENFDYHAYIAPLNAAPGETLTDRQNFPLVVSDRDGLPTYVQTVGVSDVNIGQFFNNTQGGSQELGFQRVIQVINDNMTNNIFRKGVHTLVVMISNGNDTDNIINPQNGAVVGSNYPTRLEDMKKFTKTYHDSLGSGVSQAYKDSLLKALTFRFFSVVAHSTCQAGFYRGTNYINMSNDLYAYSGASDQAGDPTPDSYDICTGSFSNLFTSVGQSLPVTVVNHVYDWWPVGPSLNFNQSTMKVWKVTEFGKSEIPESATNGYQLDTQAKTNHNIRKAPAVSPEIPGEYFSGYFVKLNGTGEVTSPSCVIVEKYVPNAYYGYIVLPRKPKPSETTVKIDDQVIPQSSTDGWSYQGYSESINIRIMGPNDHSSHPDGEYESGYVIKLNGSAFYTNEDYVKVNYKPDSI